MLSHFPQVRDEESTYSIFSRMHFALQPPSYFIMGKILFNRASKAGSLNFQGPFDYLCSNLPPKFTPKNFFCNNTIYPLFIPFISTEKQEKALELFKGDYSNRINRYLIVSNINGTRRYIRICKECVKEDFNLYGEPYYRRQHEIELNRMCIKHKIPLYEYIISNYRVPRRYDDCYTVLSSSKEITIPESLKERFIYISEDINSIFTLNLDNWDIGITKKKISNILIEKGYITCSGTKLHDKICEDFKRYYSEEFLDYIGYNIDINSPYNWLSSTTGMFPDENPIKFILVIRFLFGSFQSFYQYNKNYPHSTFINL